jgi:glycosyltransferase involved in cell wall biosynthesis
VGTPSRLGDDAGVVMEGEGLPGPRVLLACEWFVKYTAGLARGLADIGCEVTLLTRDHDLEFGREPGAMRAFVDGTLAGRGRHLELGGRVRDLARVGDVARLRGACRRWGPEVVHVQDSLTHDMRLAVAAGFPRRRYALTVHDPTPHPGDLRPSARIRIVRRALRRRAGLVFVHSPILADELLAAGETRGPIEVVPHGFGDVVETPLPGRPSLLFFGRISHYKGLDVLLDAMPLVWERRPEVTLTVAGEGEVPGHASLADPRLTLRAEHVPEDAVPTLFAAATCVVLPYRQASQSGVGSEAKRFGRAIVATDVGGLPDLVTPDCGRLVPPQDSRALAKAILEVVDTPGLAAEMGRNASDSVRDAGWRSVAAKTLDAYRRVLL